MPHELTAAEITAIVEAFVAVTLRAKRIGFDVVELHSAHGYLLHQFLSPLSNQRKDEYGKNRMKFPLEVARAVREVVAEGAGARRAHQRATTGPTAASGPTTRSRYARELERIGFDYVCVSSGALVPHAEAAAGAPGYQVPFAEKVKKAMPDIKVRAVGMIADPEQAEADPRRAARPTWWRWRARSSTTRAGSGMPPSASA